MNLLYMEPKTHLFSIGAYGNIKLFENIDTLPRIANVAGG
jgi:hypothetical protein